MTDNIILEGLQKFLQEHVSGKISLQKPIQKVNDPYVLVNPAVHIGWIPPKLPENMTLEETVPNIQTMIPCLIVGMDDGNDDGQEAELNIRITFVTYNPGITNNEKMIPSFVGYQDLLNLITLAREELAKASVIDGITTVQKPFKWGMYQDIGATYPYWYGWLTFPVSSAAMEYVPDVAQQYL